MAGLRVPNCWKFWRSWKPYAVDPDLRKRTKGSRRARQNILASIHPKQASNDQVWIVERIPSDTMAVPDSLNSARTEIDASRLGQFREALSSHPASGASHAVRTAVAEDTRRDGCLFTGNSFRVDVDEASMDPTILEVARVPEAADSAVPQIWLSMDDARVEHNETPSWVVSSPSSGQPEEPVDREQNHLHVPRRTSSVKRAYRMAERIDQIAQAIPDVEGVVYTDSFEKLSCVALSLQRHGQLEVEAQRWRKTSEHNERLLTYYMKRAAHLEAENESLKLVHKQVLSCGDGLLTDM